MNYIEELERIAAALKEEAAKSGLVRLDLNQKDSKCQNLLK